jgi:hypothetical protein
LDAIDLHFEVENQKNAFLLFYQQFAYNRSRFTEVGDTPSEGLISNKIGFFGKYNIRIEDKPSASAGGPVGCRL